MLHKEERGSIHVQKWLKTSRNQNTQELKTMDEQSNSSVVTAIDQTFPLEISEEISRINTIIFTVFLGGFLSLFGVVANSLIISVFGKQGFSDTTNISLCALAISDVGVSLFAFFDCCFFAVYYAGPQDLGFEPMRVRALLADYPRLVLAKVSSWLTAYISCERCLCVVFPFFARSAISSKTTTVAVSVLSVTVLLIHYPIYYPMTLQWVFQPHLNRTQLTEVVIVNRLGVYKQLSAPLFSFLPLVNLSLVSLNTAILTSRLMRSSKWRQEHASANYQSQVNSSNSVKQTAKDMTSSTTSGISAETHSKCEPSGQKRTFVGMAKNQIDSNRSENNKKSSIIATSNTTTTTSTAAVQNNKNKTHSEQTRKSNALTKLITTVTFVFIVCTTPSNVSITIAILYPPFSSTGQIKNLFIVFMGYWKLLETANSVLNIFVYYKLSSKFRTTFNEMYLAERK